MYKVICLEGKAFIWLTKEEGFFKEGKIIRSFLRTNSVTPGFVPGDDVSLRTMEAALGLMTAPSLSTPGSPYKRAPACCGGSDENTQSPHTHLAPCTSPVSFLSPVLCGRCCSAC